MSPKPATITLGLVSPSLIGLGSLLPRRNLSTNASSSAKSPSRRTEAFSARMNGANELCIGVGIRPEMLGEWCCVLICEMESKERARKNLVLYLQR